MDQDRGYIKTNKCFEESTILQNISYLFRNKPFSKGIKIELKLESDRSQNNFQCLIYKN